ncbi:MULTISPECIES: hypothetical protein [unclassified Streptomyces]|uniref:hypothetical protein n=1 Tax=unclassified Streptomyces TaxID=2593676 RepID=UPI00168C02F9|nr:MULTISPECIES: hypothetical protein [unclassified Streptomyces]MBD3008329.1 hypothetical protein [Streptomyces sp. 5-10]
MDRGARRWELRVDGEGFEVGERAGEPGTYDLTWLTGPNPGYGFTIGVHGADSLSTRELEEAARDFLAQVDPETGYIE